MFSPFIQSPYFSNLISIMQGSYTISTPQRVCECIDLAQSQDLIKYNPFIDPEYTRLYLRYLWRTRAIHEDFQYEDIDHTYSAIIPYFIYGLLIVTWGVSYFYLVNDARKWPSVVAFFFFLISSLLIIAIGGG